MATKADLVRAYEETFGYVPDRIRDWSGVVSDADVDRVRASAPTAPDTGGSTGGSAGTTSTVAEVIELFESYGLDPYTHFDGTFEENRPARIAQEINSGQRTLSNLSQLLSRQANRVGVEPPVPDLRDLLPGFEEPEPIDFNRAARNLFPYFPEQLIAQFADAWEEFDDPQLALAEVRQSDLYDDLFPGIKRDDGSLRMSEQEWFSTREAYSRLFQEFGLNDTLFNDRFTELMEGEVSPQELSGRLGAAYEMINNQLPEVAEEFREFYGGNSEAALFASFIDPDIGQAILDRRISVAQVAGEGTARGFDVDETFAGRLVRGGVGQEMARNFFVQAEGQLQTLDDLARRHRDPDDTFDLEEFAEANVFGDASQTRRIRRLLRAEASMFTDQLGQVRTQGGAVTGLSPR